MSYYSSPYITNEQSSLPPILRLIDELGQYSRNSDHPNRSQTKPFTPKFDIKELRDSYELYGELPGVDQKDIDLEFTDASTITVKGHVERSGSRGPNGERTKAALKATVEDEDEEQNNTATVKKTQDIKAEVMEKFWVTERNVGHFSRSFSFPDRVDQDNVKATMKNGILNIIVPKAKRVEGRRIVIQ
ncbi:hypothetical protein K3495_g10949 [Podosphaera aphanis]|nr:hypothetical protein K3495_g10949 [Podosphaera aphanis]